MKGFAAAALLALQASVGFAKPVDIFSGSNSVQTRQEGSGAHNAVYFTNWGIYDRDFQPADTPVEQISQILYAFLNVKADGTVYTGDSYADLEKHYPDDSWNDTGNNAYGCVKQFFQLKQANRHLKVLLSIGGWTWSDNIHGVVLDDAKIQKFAQTSVELMKDWGMDGIDIDFEYPESTEEGAGLVKLVKAIRTEMDSYSEQYSDGYHFLITAAMPAGPTNYANEDLAGLNENLDFLNLMAYDYAGATFPGQNVSAHQANLYPSDSDPSTTPFSTEKAITDYLAADVDPAKILLGMPLYGRAFVGTDGLGKPFTGAGSGSWEDGTWDYKVLPKDGAVEKTDDVAGATYSFDEASSTLISYDTVDMVNEKMKYIADKGLGGSMFWEISGDRTDDGSLIAAAANAIGQVDQTQNCITFPNSVYDNIASGLGNSTRKA